MALAGQATRLAILPYVAAGMLVDENPKSLVREGSYRHNLIQIDNSRL
jgi:hypothetical protein